jgi:hypothetical protein
MGKHLGIIVAGWKIPPENPPTKQREIIGTMWENYRKSYLNMNIWRF